MEKFGINDVIKYLVPRGIEISCVVNCDRIEYSLNTLAKCWARLYTSESGNLLSYTRYKSPVPVQNIDEILDIVADCLRESDIGNDAWFELLVQEGYLTKTATTTTTYS